MTPAELDAKLTREHLERHSYVARIGRYIERLEDHISNKKRTSHRAEVESVISGAYEALRGPISTRESDCHQFCCDIDIKIESYGSSTQRLLKKVFNLV